MKTRYYLTLLLVALVASGCNDFLGIKPKGFHIPRTAKDYEALLNDYDIVKSSETYPVYLTDDAFIPDVDETGILTGMDAVDVATRNLYTFQSETFGASEDDPLWFNSFKNIYTYNVVIQNVVEASEANEKEKLEIQAQALTGRALEYFTLVNAYAVQYDANTASQDLAVPLIIDDATERPKLTRATVAEVYQLVIEDLEKAIENLPTKKPAQGAFKATKNTAYAILARVYLQQGEYTKAQQYADASLEVFDQLLDLKPYKVEDPKKAIGRIKVPELNDNPENVFIRMAPYVFGMSSQVCLSEELEALFSPEDKRRELFFTNKPYDMPSKYYLWMPYIRENLAIATPEIYLIAAECAARLGNKERALTLLDKLRDHRIVNNKPLVAKDNEEALTLVLEERRRELAFKGPIRLFDLKRLNKEASRAKTIRRTVEGVECVLKPNDPKYVLPIPAKVLRFNPDMKDNVR